MVFLPKLICLEARSTIKGAPGILARILGEKALKQARNARVRGPSYGSIKQSGQCYSKRRGGLPQKLWGQPALYTSPSNRSICGDNEITVDKECQEIRARTSLAAAATAMTEINDHWRLSSKPDAALHSSIWTLAFISHALL
jgi:hypothetical protein